MTGKWSQTQQQRWAVSPEDENKNKNLQITDSHNKSPIVFQGSFVLPEAAAVKPSFSAGPPEGEETSVSDSGAKGDQWPEADLCHGTFHVQQAPVILDT